MKHVFASVLSGVFSLTLMGLSTASAFADPTRKHEDLPPPAQREIDDGSPLAPGERTVRQHNVPFMVTGAVTFGIAYLPFAIDGIVQTATYGSRATNFHETAALRAIPVFGPPIMLLAYNQAQVSDCTAARMNPMFFASGTQNPLSSQTPCINNASTGMPPDYQPALAHAGEWIWASVLTGAQIVGIYFFVRGWIGDRYRERAPQATSTAQRMPSFSISPVAFPSGGGGLSLQIVTM